MGGDLRMTRRQKALMAATSPTFREPLRATAPTALFAFSSDLRALIPESHTATTFLNHPWATWGPRWPSSRVQVRGGPRHLAEHRTDPQMGAGLM